MICIIFKSMWNVTLGNLTLSWLRSLSCRNQSIDLICKSIDWFLCDRGLHHERVKKFISLLFPMSCRWELIHITLHNIQELIRANPNCKIRIMMCWCGNIWNNAFSNFASTSTGVTTSLLFHSTIYNVIPFEWSKSQVLAAGIFNFCFDFSGKVVFTDFVIW